MEEQSLSPTKTSFLAPDEQPFSCAESPIRNPQKKDQKQGSKLTPFFAEKIQKLSADLVTYKTHIIRLEQSRSSFPNSRVDREIGAIKKYILKLEKFIVNLKIIAPTIYGKHYENLFTILSSLTDAEKEEQRFVSHIVQGIESSLALLVIKDPKDINAQQKFFATLRWEEIYAMDDNLRKNANLKDLLLFLDQQLAAQKIVDDSFPKDKKESLPSVSAEGTSWGGIHQQLTQSSSSSAAHPLIPTDSKKAKKIKKVKQELKFSDKLADSKPVFSSHAFDKENDGFVSGKDGERLDEKRSALVEQRFNEMEVRVVAYDLLLRTFTSADELDAVVLDRESILLGSDVWPDTAVSAWIGIHGLYHIKAIDEDDNPINNPDSFTWKPVTTLTGQPKIIGYFWGKVLEHLKSLGVDENQEKIVHMLILDAAIYNAGAMMSSFHKRHGEKFIIDRFQIDMSYLLAKGYEKNSSIFKTTGGCEITAEFFHIIVNEIRETMKKLTDSYLQLPAIITHKKVQFKENRKKISAYQECLKGMYDDGIYAQLRKLQTQNFALELHVDRLESLQDYIKAFLANPGILGGLLDTTVPDHKADSSLSESSSATSTNASPAAFFAEGRVPVDLETVSSAVTPPLAPQPSSSLALGSSTTV